MKRSVRAAAITGVLALALALGTSAAAAQASPLLGGEFNCSESQSQFGGDPQPAGAGQNVNLSVAIDCYLVLGIGATGGQSIEFAYLSGSYGSLNIAFYESSAAPGGAFSDPPDVALGGTRTSLAVPGTGSQQVLVAVQGVGGPESGSASVRLTPGNAPPPTSPAPTTAAPTSVAPTTAAPTTAAPSSTAPPATTTPTTGEPVTTVEAEATTSAAPTSSAAETSTPESTVATSAAGEDEAVASAASEPSEDSDSPVPWWLLAILVGGALVWLGVMTVRARRPAAPLPWERHVLSWTLQHAAPTGTCSSSARALVDPDDDGLFSGYSVTALFALPRTGKRVRSSIGDPLLAQLEALWATEPSGAELKSAVDAYVNTLCRRLDGKKVRADSTLLVQMTKPDVVVHGEVHACVEGGWQMFEGWRDVPGLPAGQVQHDIVQVAVLGVGRDEDSKWLDRADELSEAITELIDTRRAPAGLWVFD